MTSDIDRQPAPEPMRASKCLGWHFGIPFRSALSWTALVAALVGLTPGCAHRYSEDPEDWVGPRDGDFEADFTICRKRMDDAGFRYRGDTRLIFLDCMKKRHWHLKGRS